MVLLVRNDGENLLIVVTFHQLRCRVQATVQWTMVCHFCENLGPMILACTSSPKQHNLRNNGLFG